MQILGDVKKLKDNQMVGVYSPNFQLWIIGRVYNISEEGISVHEEGKTNNRFLFNDSGECIAPDSMSGSYHLVYCKPLPYNIRFGSTDRAAKEYLNDIYFEQIISGQGDPEEEILKFSR